ncbi:S1C family serine protease [Pseudonocardia sp. H11422]|uniref:S1C family serine protease n=1 Tax=Pseudonocardia sp. H11422 TaxID=2835866 RepID=UPI001BDD6FE1|nr:trypsin-like peptidase domain-containing protein [Pseudonocardia sp. H11422]
MRRTGVVVGHAVLAMTLVAGLASACTSSPAGQIPADQTVGGSLERQYADVVNKVLPSVAEIQSPTGTGSGVVFDSDGHIVTNAHVVGRETRFNVRLSTGTEQLPATLVSSYPPDDLAVIKIEGGPNLRPARFGRSADLRPGDIVMAMGSPLGLEASVTEGIVSAVGRTVPEPPSENSPGTVLRQAIQTSAPINPGNSGGALVDLNGQVVGIPTLAATLPQLGGTAPGIGFALPSDLVTDLATQIVANGRVVNSRRASLGASVQTVTDPEGKPVGVGIVAVQPGGPAATAGLRPGDVITAIGGNPVTDVITLQAVLAEHVPGDTVQVTVLRNGATVTVPVVLGQQPAT